MGVESLAGGVGAAVGEAVGSGLSSGAEVGSGALGVSLSTGIAGFASEAPSLSSGAGRGLFSGPEFSPSLGGPDFLGGRAGSLADFQLAFNFGSDHSVSGEIYPGKAVSEPGRVFHEGLFGVIAKPSVPETKPEPTPKLEAKTLDELFGPQLETVGLPLNEGPLSHSEIDSLALEQSFISTKMPSISVPEFQPINPPTIPKIQLPQTVEKTEAAEPISSKTDLPVVEQEIALFSALWPKKKEEEETERGKQVSNRRSLQPGGVWEPKTVWQILTGDILPQVKSQAEGEDKSAIKESARMVEPKPAEQEVLPGAGKEAEVITQPASDSGRNGGKVKISAGEEEAPAEEIEEPIWEVSGKKSGGEAVDESVLKRRFRVAQEVVETSRKETERESNSDKNRFLSRVTTRLLALDIPTPKEILRIVILGNLKFPFIAQEAKRSIGELRNYELNPEGILKTVQKVVAERPPLTSKAGKMEHAGFLPQSKLEEMGQEPVVLAQKGAKHLIFDWRGRWKRVEKKPSRYPWELDRTGKTVPIESVDRKNSSWYTLFTERTQARVKRIKAKS